MTHRLRVTSYNVHKCRGLDQRVRPDRIVNVLREINADVIALQEVLCIRDQHCEADQAHYIAEQLGFAYRLGENRQLNGGAYGNVVLSRLPIILAHNHDISVKDREERGCLRVDLALGRHQVLHVFNVHLGTSWNERRQQARLLTETEILSTALLPGPRLLMGDFNEWTHGLASRLLNQHFRHAELNPQRVGTRSYPGVLPFLTLDYIYYDHALQLEATSLHRSSTALIASDHLPIVADFQFSE